MRVPRGVFSKTLLGREWDRVPQRESEPAHRGTPFRREMREKADLTGMEKFAILYTRDEWITHNKKRMQFFLREGKKSEQAV